MAGGSISGRRRRGEAKYALGVENVLRTKPKLVSSDNNAVCVKNDSIGSARHRDEVKVHREINIGPFILKYGEPCAICFFVRCCYDK